VRQSRMQRVLRAAAPVVVAACVAVATSAAAGVTAIKVSTALGSKIVATSNGLALYHYTAEKKGAIACVGACAKTWLPLLASSTGKLQAGPGLSAAKLGTIKRPDGTLQITYNGLALYRYAHDKAGQAKGQGLSGAWFAITPTGTVTRAVAPAAGGPSGGSAPPTGVTSGGGGTSPMPATNCNPNVLVTDPNDPCYNTAH
jgi:predicted lipoprotein with Yx(FWY)xxD motif